MNKYIEFLKEVEDPDLYRNYLIEELEVDIGVSDDLEYPNRVNVTILKPSDYFTYILEEDDTEKIIEVNRFYDLITDFFDEFIINEVMSVMERYDNESNTEYTRIRLERELTESLINIYGYEWQIVLRDKLLSRFGIDNRRNYNPVKITMKEDMYED